MTLLEALGSGQLGGVTFERLLDTTTDACAFLAGKPSSVLKP
jgi:hypothetical protein